MEVYSIFLLRFLICFILSFIIGLEREFNNKMGLKVNMLVSVGTFLFCTIAIKFSDVEEQARILAQIISGIGFIGAGSIVTNDNEVKGLNTAATVWCVTASSILVSFGYIVEALLGTFAVLFINIVFKKHHSNNRMINNYILKIKYHADEDISRILLPLSSNIIYSNVKNCLFDREYKVISLNLQNIYRGDIESLIKLNSANPNIKRITYDEIS